MNVKRQTYDGATNMSGAFNGCEAIVCNKQPLALYVHCAAHFINLTAQRACASVPFDRLFVRDALAVVQELGSLFSTSSNLMATFHVIAQQTENSGQFTKKIKRLCPTRWLVRVNPNNTSAVVSVVLQSLNEIIQSNSHVATRARDLYKTLVTGSTAFDPLMSLLILRPLEEINKT